jgi:hypothetical protein
MENITYTLIPTQESRRYRAGRLLRPALSGAARIAGPAPIAAAQAPKAPPGSYPKKARPGELHGQAKLTKETVLGIRAWAAELVNAGKKPTWTAKSKEMGISEGTLRDIVSLRTWTHV